MIKKKHQALYAFSDRPKRPFVLHTIPYSTIQYQTSHNPPRPSFSHSRTRKRGKRKEKKEHDPQAASWKALFSPSKCSTWSPASLPPPTSPMMVRMSE